MGRGEGHCIDGAAEVDCKQRTATPEVLAADKIIDKEHTGTNETRGGGGRRVWREALKFDHRESGYWIFVQGDLWILDIRMESTSEFSVSGPYAAQIQLFFSDQW